MFLPTLLLLLLSLLLLLLSLRLLILFCGVAAVGVPLRQRFAQVIASMCECLRWRASQQGTRLEPRAPLKRRHVRRTAHLAVKREDEDLVIVTIVIACVA